jgi:quercetin dioxygenase-like cupin family protein
MRREFMMQTVDTTTMNLVKGGFEKDPTVRFRANFALHGGNGVQQASVVVIELEPGNALGEHTDSPEEVLLVLEGVVEFTVGGERARAGRGTLAVVPPMVPHSIRNVGNDTARVVGFFPSPTVVATFVEAIQPLGERVLVVGDRSYRERLPELRSSRPLASR